MKPVVGFFLAVVSAAVLAQGNTQIDSFNRAKKILEKQVYADHRVTFYCRAEFDQKKNVVLPAGFVTPEHEKRAHRVEWEHVVPAENFGRAFVEWREGDAACVDKKGRPFKGRKCAEKANSEFRFMQADLYNLYPSIGAVNALRSNYRYALLPNESVTFGSCAMKVADRRVEPPEYTRGAIARTTLYMAENYAAYRLASSQKQLMQAWDKMYPVDAWECKRAARIEKLQGNRNDFVAVPCQKEDLYRQ